MHTFNIKKRRTWSFAEFLKNKVVLVKTGEDEIVKKAYSGDVKGDKGIATLDESKVEEAKVWKGKLQKQYTDLADFKNYDETYGLAKKLGFNSAEEAWKSNPTIQGSTDPKDYKIAEEYKMVLDGPNDISEEYAKLLIDRAIENSTAQESIDMKVAYDELVKEDEAATEHKEIILGQAIIMLKDMIAQIEKL